MIATGFPIVPVIVCVTLCLVFGLGYVIWMFEPWWHSNPSPRRAIRDTKDEYRIWRFRNRHPDAYLNNPMPIVKGGKLVVPYDQDEHD